VGGGRGEGEGRGKEEVKEEKIYGESKEQNKEKGKHTLE